MSSGPGFDVRPDALRAAAAGLRDDAHGLDVARASASEAAQALIPVGGALGAAASDFASRIDRALGALGHGVVDVAGALDASAAAYVADDQAGAAGFAPLMPPPLAGPGAVPPPAAVPPAAVPPAGLPTRGPP